MKPWALALLLLGACDPTTEGSIPRDVQPRTAAREPSPTDVAYAACLHGLVGHEHWCTEYQKTGKRVPIGR